WFHPSLSVMVAQPAVPINGRTKDVRVPATGQRTGETYQKLAIEARQLAVKIQAFILSHQAPPHPGDPAKNAEYDQVIRKFNVETVSQFGATFGPELFAFVNRLKDAGFGDTQLDRDISMLNPGLESVS